MNSARKFAEDVHFEAAPTAPAPAPGLAVVGEHDGSSPVAVSPARDLQQRLESSVLRSFYAEAEPARHGQGWRMLVILVSAGTCWAGVFGSGYLLFG